MCPQYKVSRSSQTQSQPNDFPMACVTDGPLLWTECLCLLELHMPNPVPQCDGVRRWGLGVIRHERGAPCTWPLP